MTIETPEFLIHNVRLEEVTETLTLSLPDMGDETLRFFAGHISELAMATFKELEKRGITKL